MFIFFIFTLVISLSVLEY